MTTYCKALRTSRSTCCTCSRPCDPENVEAPPADSSWLEMERNVAHQECAELREQIARAIEAMRQDAFDMHGEDDEPYYATVSQTLDAVLDVVRSLA